MLPTPLFLQGARSVEPCENIVTSTKPGRKPTSQLATKEIIFTGQDWGKDELKATKKTQIGGTKVRSKSKTLRGKKPNVEESNKMLATWHRGSCQVLAGPAA